MRVRLKLELDCSPDAAWELVRSPAAFREVSSPLLRIRSREPGGFPELWGAGAHRVGVRLLGIVPLGDQVIDLSFREHRGARIMLDSGGPVSGALSAVTGWRHQMAVSPSRRGDGTLYRDQLQFRAGALGLPLWPVFWFFWQLRAARIRRMAARADSA